MEERLKENFDYIQKRIEEIKSLRYIDIKQISDLQRYIEMQKHIAQSLRLLRLMEEEK